MKKIISVIAALALVLSLSINCFAMDFVESIGAKDAPERIEAKLYDKEGNVSDVPLGEVILTPYSEVKEAKEAAIVTRLSDAYKEIRSNEMINSLNARLAEEAKKIGKNNKASDFVVTELFDVHFTSRYLEAFINDGYIIARFDLGLKADTPTPVVAVRDANGNWKCLDSNDVKRNDDGTLSIKITDAESVAFMNIPNSVINNNPEKDSPKTGEMTDYSVVAVSFAVVCLIVAGAYIVLKNRKENA